MVYQEILFDLDGTLTDPKVGITRSVQYALSKLGISEENPDVLVSFIGAPLFECIRKRYSLDDSQVRQTVGFYREFYSNTGIYENVVYPGISDMLDELNSKGKRLIVATLKPTVFAERVLEHFGLRVHFDLVVGSNLEATGLSKTEIIQQAVGLLSESRQDAVMVGDREHDVIGARSNGINSIAVTYGYGSLEELRNAGPTHFADSVENLKALLLRSFTV